MFMPIFLYDCGFKSWKTIFTFFFLADFTVETSIASSKPGTLSVPNTVNYSIEQLVK